MIEIINLICVIVSNLGHLLQTLKLTIKTIFKI